MSHSPEQMRKKAEAMREAVHHNEHSTVDGDPSRRFMSKTEMLDEDMMEKGAKQGLHMERD